MSQPTTPLAAADLSDAERLLLYSLDREVRQIAELLGGGLTVPQRARAQLVETIGAIAPLLPIHADLPELAAQIDSEPADPKLYAHLLPLQDGLRLQLLVRPLAGGSWLRPGQGAESVLGDSDGKPVQARRDLAAERQTLEQVLQACPALAEADSDGHEWQLAEPQVALQALGELQALDSEQLECVWPEGERMRIGGRPQLGNLQLNLRQRGEWFELDGELTLDEGRVLQLRQLLELLRASPGPQLVVAPTSVSLNWLAEARRFAPTLQLHDYRERRTLDGLGPRDLVVVSYGLLQQEAAAFAARHWTSVVLDEAQAIKNAASKRSKAVMALGADFRLVATGTPVENHLAIVRAWLDARGIHYQYLDGATPAKERQARVEAFQGGDGEIFLISLKAGGSGLNLTAADYVTSTPGGTRRWKTRPATVPTAWASSAR